MAVGRRMNRKMVPLQHRVDLGHAEGAEARQHYHHNRPSPSRPAQGRHKGAGCGCLSKGRQRKYRTAGGWVLNQSEGVLSHEGGSSVMLLDHQLQGLNQVFEKVLKVQFVRGQQTELLHLSSWETTS
jgi:hypothetical protein